MRALVLVLASSFAAGCCSPLRTFSAELYVATDDQGDAMVTSVGDGQHLVQTASGKRMLTRWSSARHPGEVDPLLLVLLVEKEGYVPAVRFVLVNKWGSTPEEAQATPNEVRVRLQPCPCAK